MSTCPVTNLYEQPQRGPYISAQPFGRLCPYTAATWRAENGLKFSFSVNASSRKQFIMIFLFAAFLSYLSFSGITVWAQQFDSASAPTITLNSGPVRGRLTQLPGSNTSVNQFSAFPLPDLRSPILRSAPPQDPEAWEDIYNATSQPVACMQYSGTRGEAREISDALFNNPPPPGESEDCLYMNVYAPSGEAMARQSCSGSLEARIWAVPLLCLCTMGLALLQTKTSSLWWQTTASMVILFPNPFTKAKNTKLSTVFGNPRSPKRSTSIEDFWLVNDSFSSSGGRHHRESDCV